MGAQLEPEVTASLITGAATLLAAIVVGIFGALIGAWLSRQRDHQDRESQWRSHAVELTKLDLERKLKAPPDRDKRLRPSILDFLANYRDLKELDEKSPGALYETILRSRISGPEADDPPPLGAPTEPRNRGLGT